MLHEICLIDIPAKIEGEDVINREKVFQKKEKFLSARYISLHWKTKEEIGRVVKVYLIDKKLYGLLDVNEGTVFSNICRKNVYSLYGYIENERIDKVIVRVLPRSRGESMVCKGCGNIFRMHKVWLQKGTMMWRCICGQEYTQLEYEQQHREEHIQERQEKIAEYTRLQEEEKRKEEARIALEKAQTKAKKLQEREEQKEKLKLEKLELKKKEKEEKARVKAAEKAEKKARKPRKKKEENDEN